MLPTIALPRVDAGPFDFAADSGFGAVSWAPLPGPQSLAFDSPAFELLYGGAAGGGKSDLLLGLARKQHRRALLLRRTFPDAERSLITRSLEFYGDRRAYNQSKHLWKIDGRQIEIGHLEYEKDVYQYQGAAYDLIGFDELTQFTRLQYEYLISRARTTRKRQRVRVVSATNPGGEGNEWVMDRWAAWLSDTHPHPAQPGELRWYRRQADGREVETTADDPDGMSRTFIPAVLSDNPYLGDDYRRVLALLPEPLRSQLARGDWKAGLTDDAYQVMPRAWVRAAMARWARPDGTPNRIGVDVARGGDDKTVFAPLHGSTFGELRKFSGRETPDGASVAGLLKVEYGDEPEFNMDVIGIGASAYDFAINAGLAARPVNFAAGTSVVDTTGQLHFSNVRAAAYWMLREALDPNAGGCLALPDDPELLGDLCAARWKMTTRGVQIEDKEQIHGRLGRSPDCGDAVVLAYWLSVSALDLVAGV